MKRPGKRASPEYRLQVQRALARLQAVVDDVLDVARQNSARMVLPDRAGELERGAVEIRDAAVASQFHGRVGIELGKRRQFLQFGLGPNPLHRHREHGRHGEDEMDLVLREFPLARGVGPEEAERLPMSGDRNRDSTDDTVVRQQG